MSKSLKTIFILLFLCGMTAAQTMLERSFADLSEKLNEVLESNAQILFPDQYSEAFKSYSEAKRKYKEGYSVKDIQEYLSVSADMLMVINNDLQNRNTFFNVLLEARKQAILNKADNYAVYHWDAAESALLDALDEYEDNNTEEAETFRQEAVENYRSSVTYTSMAVNDLLGSSLLESTDKSLACLLAPESYDAGISELDNALESIADGDEQDEINEKIQQSLEHFKRAEQTADEMKSSHNGLLDFREEALNSGAEQYAYEEWSEAENMLRNAGKEFEFKNYEDVPEIIDESSGYFIKARQEAVRNKLVEVQEVKISKAKDIGADESAPKTLEKSELLVAEANDLINENRFTESSIEKLTEEAAKTTAKAVRIAEVANKIDSGEKTLEDYIYEWNIFPDKKEVPVVVKTEPPLVEKPVEKVIVPVEVKEEPPKPDRSAQLRSVFAGDEVTIREDDKKIVIHLVGLEFRTESVSLDNKDVRLLNKAIKAIELYPGSFVTLAGNADNIGAKSYNQKISLRRANRVRNYILANSQIDEFKLVAVGNGEEYPIATNRTRKGRAINRRVDIIIKK